MAPIVIVVDGVIASGKTTLIRKCLVPGFEERDLRVVEFYEPVDEWKQSGRLAQFYENPARRAFQFETRVLHDQVALWRKLYDPTADVIVAERSIYTTLIFMEALFAKGEFDATEREDFVKLWHMAKLLMPCQVDLFIYLHTPLNEAMRRLAVRNRAEECGGGGGGGVDLAYQTLLEQKHDEFFQKLNARSLHMGSNYQFDYIGDTHDAQEQRRLIMQDVQRALEF